MSDDKYFLMKKLRDEIKQKNDDKYKVGSKKRLLSNISKKFQTTMIGALSSFEKRFKHLWERDDRFRRLWDEARTEILDLGNKNQRAAEQEISEYTISWDRYQTEFVFNKENKDNGSN